MSKDKKISPIVSVKNIQRQIYFVRGQKVMLDKDLAKLYGVKPIRLREQVKRNKERFPEDFMFQLTDKETDIMVSQNSIPSKKHLGGHLPYVFTEYGAVMLASILNTAVAVQMSIFVVRAFVKLKEMLFLHKELAKKLGELEKRVNGSEMEIRTLFEAIRGLMDLPEKKKKRIGFVNLKS
ncbi:MAG: ORF6N domain-containing protein [Elusimicrobia bacterium]|nr:ORF6N domain-containing protein [Elusimicrobiota bacterium]